MMIESDSSETNLVILTRRHRFILFCKLYWRYLVIFITPLVLLPVLFIGHNEAYSSFYVFLLCATYWVSDAIHPGVVSLLPIALSSVLGSVNYGFISEMYLRNELLDCFGVMMIILAIEESLLHKRCAIKLLLIFGCSHFRLSFLIFFTCMFLSMWISSVMACGVMMPVVKAILVELEKMGILEVYQIVGKARQKSYRHGEKHPRPTELTVFYFLGIAYSSSIGAAATLMGSQSNQIFKIYCETLFPNGPRVEFPRFMLLNLPGTIVMETLLYFWMNFWFLGMFRNANHSHETVMTEEEAQYTNTLLANQYRQLGGLTLHEGIVLSLVVLAMILQATVSSASIDHRTYGFVHNHFRVSSPCIFTVFLLFVLLRDLEFTKFFKNRSGSREPLPQTTSPSCLKWVLIENRIHWSVLFIVEGSSALFQSLKDSHMTVEMANFLLLFKDWPSPAMMLVIIIFFKCITEFAPNSTIIYCLLPNIARVAVTCNINPHYLMMAATLAASFPFHLTMGCPVNAMVAAYVHIPPFKMISSGCGLTISSIVTTWFTVAAWSAAVWTQVPHQNWTTEYYNVRF